MKTQIIDKRLSENKKLKKKKASTLNLILSLILKQTKNHQLIYDPPIQKNTKKKQMKSLLLFSFSCFVIRMYM